MMTFIEKLNKLVIAAGELMSTERFEIEQKNGCENIVTSSDLAVQNFLCEELSKLLPGSGFLCEERDINDCEHEYTWTRLMAPRTTVVELTSVLFVWD